MAARLGWVLALCIAMAPGLARAAEVVDVVKDFGAKGDGATDDWEAIQRAIGMNEEGICPSQKPRDVVIPRTPDNIYVISEALRPCSNVTLTFQASGTTIVFKGNARSPDYTGATHLGQWLTQAALTGGSMHSNAYDHLPSYPLAGAVSNGQSEVKLADPALTNTLRTGDIVAVETARSYRIGPALHPNRLSAAVVRALAGDGVVSLDRPIDFAAPEAQLRQLSNLARSPAWPTVVGAGGDTRIPAVAVRNFNIAGGVWVAGDPHPEFKAFLSIGGCVDCAIAPERVVAGFGVGSGNFMQNCRFSVRQEDIAIAPLEVAFASSHTTIDIGAITARQTLPAPGSGLIVVDEGSRQNVITIGAIVLKNDKGMSEDAFLAGRPDDAAKLEVTVFSPQLNANRGMTLSYAPGPSDPLDRIAAELAQQLNATPAFASSGFSASPIKSSGRDGIRISNSHRDVAFHIAMKAAGSLKLYAPPQDAVRIEDATSNKVTIRELDGYAVAGEVIDFVGQKPRSQDVPAGDNVVTIEKSRLAYQFQFVALRGPSAAGNRVVGAQFEGTALEAGPPVRP